MLKTAICNLFDIKYPIIHGGMGHVATVEPASAVSNAGRLVQMLLWLKLRQ